ncbi:MAG: hypothetical protein MJY71_01475 [Bacteroidaceae bacterium]|nr:hypothetical protein [Bacteroidaceae bacterium]
MKKLCSILSVALCAILTVSCSNENKPSGNENGYDYVDLGLSVKWATCNIGAEKPEDYGDYFAWGETEPYYITLDPIAWPKDKSKGYDWSSYKYSNNSSSLMSKYCTNAFYGTVDNKSTLDLSDDAANANWGGSWRMPTRAEQDELRNDCTWEWTSLNGVYGFKVTSKKAGYTNRSIFLPAAGYRYFDGSIGVGSTGNYWSSSLYSNFSSYSYNLYFNSEIFDWYNDCRYKGQSVRAVCK